MIFELIATINKFDFYELKRDNYYELWIMNKEKSIMELVYGDNFRISKDTVKRLYARNYFDHYFYDEDFTDQEE